MNAEEEENNNQMPDQLKEFLQNFESTLRHNLGEARNKAKPPKKPGKAQPPLNLIDAMALSKILEDLTEAKNHEEGVQRDLSIMRAVITGELKRAGVDIVLFTKYNETPVVMRDDTVNKLKHPTWKIHSFEWQQTRVGVATAPVPGDKLVVVASDPTSAKLLSYYVHSTCGKPDDDDFRVECDFAGGCSIHPDVFISNDVAMLRNILREALFDSAVCAPPVCSDLSDLLNDPEFQMLQDLL